jgi:hypothetical protein
VNLAGLLWVARRRFGPLGGRALVLSLGRTAVACVPLLVWCVVALRVGEHLALDTTVRVVIWLGVTIGVGAVVFWAASALVRAPERVTLWGMLPGRRSR